MGVEAQTNVVMGRDFSPFSLLKDGYDAVLIVGGGFDSQKILQDFQDKGDAAIPGVLMMLDFLAAIAQDRKIEVGKHVVISDAGIKTLEVARKCLELGAGKVTIVSDQPINSLPLEFQDSKALASDGIEIKAFSTIAAIGGIGDRMDRVAIEDRDLSGISRPREALLMPIPLSYQRDVSQRWSLCMLPENPKLKGKKSDGRPSRPSVPFPQMGSAVSLVRLNPVESATLLRWSNRSCRDGVWPEPSISTLQTG